MAACAQEMPQRSQILDKIAFQRRFLCFSTSGIPMERVSTHYKQSGKVPQVESSRWQPITPKCIYFTSQTSRAEKRSKQLRPKWLFVSSFISVDCAPIYTSRVTVVTWQYINTVCSDELENVRRSSSAIRRDRNISPVSNPRILGAKFSMVLHVALHIKSGSQKSKMAAEIK